MPKQPRIKNVRKSTNEPTPPPVHGTLQDFQFSQSSKFWYADGNIVLQAGDTQFKVHQSVLSRQSTVFEDMFSIPQPADNKSGDCPVVVLSDSLEDWDVLLTLLYDALSIFIRQDEGEIPPPVIASMLRLGKKYNFKHIGVQAIKYLKERFSDILWLSDSKSYMNDCILADAIAIAHENSLLSILTVAYWQLLMKYNSDEITSFFDNMDPDKKAKLRRNEPTDTLIGLENIRAVADQYSLSFARNKSLPCGLCKNRRHCSKILKMVVSEIAVGEQVKYALCAGYSFSTLGKFCEQCSLSVYDLHNRGRQRLWMDFAEIFGLKNDHNLWNGESDFD